MPPTNGHGLLRLYLASSVEGRQVTIRYARPGDVLGIAVLVGGPGQRRGAGRGVVRAVPDQFPDADRGGPPRSLPPS
jgi:hypothetical protein